AGGRTGASCTGAASAAHGASARRVGEHGARWAAARDEEESRCEGGGAEEGRCEEGCRAQVGCPEEERCQEKIAGAQGCAEEEERPARFEKQEEGAAALAPARTRLPRASRRLCRLYSAASSGSPITVRRQPCRIETSRLPSASCSRSRRVARTSG